MSFPHRDTHEPINIPQISQSIVLGPLAQPDSIEIEEAQMKIGILIFSGIILLFSDWVTVLVGATTQHPSLSVCVPSQSKREATISP